MLTEEVLAKEHRAAKKLWTAFAMSAVFYSIVAQFLSRNLIAPENSSHASLRYAVYGISITIFLGTFLLPKTLLRDPSGVEMNTRLTRLRTCAIVRSAAAEIPVLLGFVLYFVTGTTTDFFLLMGVSALLLAICYPRYAMWQEYTQKA